MKRAWLALLALLPTLWVVQAGPRALGRSSVDLQGHLWMGWHVAQEGQLTRTELLNFPEGLDLMPVLGGWLDVALLGLFTPWLGLEPGYNLVLGLYLLAAGLGGAWLARSFQVSWPAATVAGLLLQLDGFVLQHLAGGRPEQVGLGFVALALGAAWRTHQGRLHPALCALAGLPVLLVSWELSLLTVLALAWLIPWTWERKALIPLAKSAGIAALLAAPWVGLFLYRAGQVRELQEGAFSLKTASLASVGLLGWFGPWTARPGWLALAALLPLPWLLPRRLAAALLSGLALALLFALGPFPGLLEPGPMNEQPWGPFHLAQQLPLLGWFHWPDRLLAVWSLAAALAAALVVHRLQRWRWPAAAALGLALVGNAWLEQDAAHRLPAGGFQFAEHPQVAALAQLPPGAVLDLPRQPEAVHHLRYQVLQLEHGRPIRHNMVLSHLADDDALDNAALQWFYALMEPQAPAEQLPAPALAQLREQGFGYVVLHQEGWPRDRWERGRKALQAALGKPVLREGDGWICWALPE